MAIIFCTTLTPDYLWRAAPLLASLRRLPSCRKVVVSVGFDMPASDWYETARMEPTGSVCNQQGQVLDVIKAEQSDTLIMADADAVIQRDLTGQEAELLLDIDLRSIGLGPNRRGEQNGLQEIDLLRPKLSAGNTGRLLGSPLSDVAIYNCGFIVAKVSLWRQLRPAYDALAAKAAGQFGNWRACQLLLCTVIHQAGLRVHLIPQQLHSHGHAGLWPEHHVKDGRLYVQGQLVFFAHHIPGVEYS